MGLEHPNEEAIFAAALERTSPAERQAYLDEACGDDHALRARVETLLQAHAEAGDFLEAPPVSSGTTQDAPPLVEGPGTMVGRYKLLQQIGEGGMGAVFMAEQKEPVRRMVALKIIKPGMDTRQVIARFEAERQALALMDHPNIARVLEAGATATGRPYFVMELVKGVPITEYCDSNRLSPLERLALFIEVCHAVQHAHQKGIIHRDLKPTNVLVTLHDGKPVPKIIDFGVAKATSQRLTEKTMFTSFGQMLGTPAYMSPEQAEMSGLDVDTRSDIYTLGVLLYELLTGTTPFDEKRLRSAGYKEIQRIIREEEPPKPSTRLSTLKDTLATVAAQRHTEPGRLTRLVRGDLDWIVMKTLEKDRTRRYETANGLALDIQHYLSHEPVLAGPPGAAYRARKFLRRHRMGVAAGLLVAGALVAGFSAAIVGFVQANDARQQADAHRQKAEQEAERAQAAAKKAEAGTAFIREMLAAGNPIRSRGREVTVREVLDAAAAQIERRFANQPAVEADIRFTLGATYKAMGVLPSAYSNLSRSLQLRRQILGSNESQTLAIIKQLAHLSADMRRYPDAERLFREALDGQTRVLGEGHPETVHTRSMVAWTVGIQGRLAEGEGLIRQSYEIAAKSLGGDHRNTLWAQCTLARFLVNQGKYAEAKPLLEKALRTIERTQGEHQTQWCKFYLGHLLAGQGKYPEAEVWYRKSLEVGGEDSPFRQEILGGLANVLEKQGRSAEAASVRKVRLGIEQLAKATDARGTSDSAMGHSWGGNGKAEGAEKEAQLRQELYKRRLVHIDGPDVVLAIEALVGALCQQGKYAEAEPLCRETLRYRRSQSGKDDPNALWSAHRLALTLERLGKYTEAEPLLREVLEGRRKVLGGDHSETLQSMRLLAAVLHGLQDYPAAEQLGAEVLSTLARTRGEQHVSTLDAMGELAATLEAAGKKSEAESLRQRREAILRKLDNTNSTGR